MTDLTHACQQVIKNPKHLSCTIKGSFWWNRLSCGVTNFTEGYRTSSHLDDIVEHRKHKLVDTGVLLALGRKVYPPSVVQLWTSPSASYQLGILGYSWDCLGMLR